MNDINQQVDLFFDRFEEVMKNDGFCDYYRDGLLYRNGNETQIWNDSKYKICILLKEPPQSYDAREYYKVNSNFGHRIAAWVSGINLLDSGDSLSSSFESVYSKTKESRNLREYGFQNNALALVNLKKTKGGSNAVNSEIVNIVNKYSLQIKEELDILKPNIIICGGSLVFNLAINNIFNNLEYEKIIADKLFYFKSKIMILINNYHPSARTSNKDIYESVLDSFLYFKTSKYISEILK